MRLRRFTSFAFQLPGPGGALLALDGRHLVFFALLLLGLCGSANAKRVALVIGNDQYQTIPKLSNARNDASLISGVLTKAGFAVTQANDLGRERLWGTIDAFKAGINKGDEVVFYFAGHGVQIGPAQLLLATDINSRTEAQLQRDGVPLVDVQDALKDARVAIFIIDACRDNPFPKQGLRSLGATRGLLPPEPSAGQIIMMSAGRNQKALDNVPGQTRANGLFTWELAQVIQTPGIEIRSAMERVKDAVDDKARAANHEQRPSLVNDLRGNFYFFASPVAATDNTVRPGPVVVAPVMTVEQREDAFWADAKAAGNKEAFEAYVINYPTGRYANLAKANIARLSKDVQVVNAPPVVVPVITPPVTKPVITNPAKVSFVNYDRLLKAADKNADKATTLEMYNKAVQRLAIDADLDLVFQDAVWIDQRVDITEFVIQVAQGRSVDIQKVRNLSQTKATLCFVSMDSVTRDSGAATRAQKKLEAEFSKRTTEILELAKQLPANSPRLQKLKEEFQDDLNTRRNEELAIVMERANKIIREVALKQPCTVVFKEAVWVNASVDITARIVSELP